MELAEARKMVAKYRGYGKWLEDTAQATVILDNRISELEAQRDELIEACKELIIESANNITNEGYDGIEANQDNIALIEKITGKIWEEI